ncbi:MAG: acyl--CoA ligase [Acidobacteria bacterium]|nr:acyl--CoA ligase [Acidobacteriota bacterium]
MSDEPSYQRIYPPHELTLGPFIRHVAATFGNRTLVVLGDEHMSYAEVESRSAELAKGMLATGIGKGGRVGILAPNGPDWIVAYFAATRIGAIAVLLNTYWKPRELDWVLGHSDIAMLLTVESHLGNRYLDRLVEIAPRLKEHDGGQIMIESHPHLRDVVVFGSMDRSWCRTADALVEAGADVSDGVLAAIEATVSEADPAVVIYSSGSTADPKGVVHSHGAVVGHSFNLTQFRQTVADDITYTPMPLFWVGGLSFTLMSCMHVGSTLVFEERFEPGATLELIEREHVTHVAGWPHMAKALTEHPSFADRDLSSVRGGSIDALLPPELRVGNPELRANSLGMTETLGPHTIELIGSEVPAEKMGSFGRSIPGVEHKVVDPVSGVDLPRGELGEICVRGYSVMIGMLKRSREEVFTIDGWYATGDGGYFDEDGHLFFKGRMGDQIKSAGMNITPREVELVLEEHGAVMHAFVMGVPNADRGENVAAVIVFRADVTATGEELIAMTKDQLANYKVPRHVMTVANPEDLPWLESGKIDRRAVQAILVEKFGA